MRSGADAPRVTFPNAGGVRVHVQPAAELDVAPDQRLAGEVVLDDVGERCDRAREQH
jgi:hypothetical protein